MKIDGNPVGTSVSGNTVSTPTGSIAYGVHLVELQATDWAGNTASDSFLFTRVNLTASPATASLVTHTVMVNPGAAFPPPITVTFPSPQVDISEFTETLNASTRVGWGNAKRPFTLGTVSVVFQNETGLNETRMVNIPKNEDVYQLAVIAPSGTPLAAVTPSHSTSVSAVTVEVPTGFNTPGSTATLLTKSVPMADPVQCCNPFLGGPVNKALVTGEIGACFDDHESDGVLLNCFPHDPSGSQGVIEVFISGGTGQPIALRRVNSPVDADPEASWPECLDQATGSGCRDDGNTYDQAAKLGLVFGCSDYGVDDRTFDLCTGAPTQTGIPPADPYAPWYEEDGYFSAWLNPALYWTVDETAALWQQNHIDIDPYGDSCPNGGAGRVTAGLYRAATNSLAYDGAPLSRSAGTLPHPHGGGDRVNIYLGYRTGTLPEEELPETLTGDSAVSYQLSTTSPELEVRPRDSGYAVTADVHRDGFGEARDLSAIGGATSNSWEAPGAEGYQQAWDSLA